MNSILNDPFRFLIRRPKPNNGQSRTGGAVAGGGYGGGSRSAW